VVRASPTSRGRPTSEKSLRKVPVPAKVGESSQALSHDPANRLMTVSPAALVSFRCTPLGRCFNAYSSCPYHSQTGPAHTLVGAGFFTPGLKG